MLPCLTGCADTAPVSTLQGLGFGIAGYAPYRIISDGTIFAMPEIAIGLWPDVGFAFKAAHMADHAGLLLGLSG
jgi:enoyl-CoA hydratase/carnithine racemase